MRLGAIASSALLLACACKRSGAPPPGHEHPVVPTSPSSSSSASASSSPLPPSSSSSSSTRSCGALSYGIHHRRGDTFDDIAKRRAGRVPCAALCDPQPPFATSSLGRNEHGGYGFLDIDRRYCQFDAMSLPIGSCGATCDGQDALGEVSVALSERSESGRRDLCLAFQQRRGPPDVGSCDCLKDDIVWLPSEAEAGVVLYFMGAYTLDCGFPPANYLPAHPPK